MAAAAMAVLRPSDKAEGTCWLFSSNKGPLIVAAATTATTATTAAAIQRGGPSTHVFFLCHYLLKSARFVSMSQFVAAEWIRFTSSAVTKRSRSQTRPRRENYKIEATEGGEDEDVHRSTQREWIFLALNASRQTEEEEEEEFGSSRSHALLLLLLLLLVLSVSAAADFVQ
ncbi:uncharacterized protein V6R79_021862 [Siganus canaliculatus]